MAQQDLESFLAQLRGAGESIQSGYERLANLNKVEAQGRVADMAPEMLDQGRFGDLASQYAGLGDPTMVRDQMQAAMKAKEAGAAAGYSYNPEELKQLGSSPEEAALLAKAGLGAKDQLTAQRRFRLGDESERRVNISIGNLNERQTGRKESNKEMWVKELAKLKSDMRTEGSALRKVRGALKQGTAPADAVVFNFLARSVAGEKGPLSDTDRAVFMGNYGEKTYNDIVEYIRGRGTSTLIPEQREAYNELVKLAANDFEVRQEEALKGQIGRAFDYNLFEDKNGRKEFDPAVRRNIKELGYTIKFDDEGFPIPTKIISKRNVDQNDNTEKSNAGSVRQDTTAAVNQETPVTQIAAKIKDPTVKAQVQEAIDYYTQNKIPIPEQVMQQIRAAAGE